MLKQSQKFRDQMEVTKLTEWKTAEHQRKTHLYDLRARLEEKAEVDREQRAQLVRDHSELWDRLEQVRNEKIAHKDDLRRAHALEAYKVRPPGQAISSNV